MYYTVQYGTSAVCDVVVHSFTSLPSYVVVSWAGRMGRNVAHARRAHVIG